jgi:twinkle protein
MDREWKQTLRKVEVPRVYRKPEYVADPVPEDKVLAWFKGRGISETVVRRNQIEARTVWIDGAETRCLAFPYVRNKEIVNVQYRTKDKHFKLEAGAELVLYKYDDIVAGDQLIITEGQLDALSIEEAGITQCVSVPNGANFKSAPWLEAEILASIPKIILAGDNDEPGEACMMELARRLGAERCWKVEWPEGCKDANDVLVRHGADAVRKAIDEALPLPVDGLLVPNKLLTDLKQLYTDGVNRGIEMSWPNLAEIYRPRPGELTIVTGAPSSGKSSVLDAFAVDLARTHEWVVAMFSPEQAPVHAHLSQLIEIWAGNPFFRKEKDFPDWDYVEDTLTQLQDHFVFIEPTTSEDFSLDGILHLAKVAVLRHGIQGLILDPWNEIEHRRPDGMSETEYISLSLTKIKHFARRYGIHIWLLAHPTKLQRRDDGTYPVAGPYDISGSAHWFNKADMCLSIFREKAKNKEQKPVQIHVQKVRFRETGRIGMIELWYDQKTGQLSMFPTVIVGEED